MSRLLANLLDVPEALFADEIERLERATGQAGVDVRLTADIIANLHHCYKSLGLDPQDTTGPELFRSLQTLVGLHDTFLVRRVGASGIEDVNAVLPRIADFVLELPISKSTWVIRHSTAKKLLKSMPPKAIMQQLHHRSVDSMLRHEPIVEILAALRFTETEQWQSEFVKKYQKLSPRDFEERDIAIIYLTSKRWGSLASEFVRLRRHNVTHSKEYGIVALLPLPVKELPGITMAVVPRILHYINEIRLYSACFRFSQMQPDFGGVIAEKLTYDHRAHGLMADTPIHWRIIQRHFGKSLPADFPEIFDPHVRREDLAWNSVEEILQQIEPALQFWQNIAYVGAIYPDKIISCNLFDNANAFVARRNYESQPQSHLRLRLKEEIQQRYLAHPSIEQAILSQLAHTDARELIGEVNF